MENVNLSGDEIRFCLKAQNLSESDIGWLAQFQYLHDRVDPLEWEEKLRAIAFSNDLSQKVLEDPSR